MVAMKGGRTAAHLETQKVVDSAAWMGCYWVELSVGKKEPTRVVLTEAKWVVMLEYWLVVSKGN